MKKVFVICFCASILGFFNFCFNTNRPIILHDENFSSKIFSENILIIDARSSAEYLDRHIKNSINLSEEKFDTQISDFLNSWAPEKKIAIYCNPKNCNSSLKIGKILKRDYGIENIVILNGDWREWIN